MEIGTRICVVGSTGSGKTALARELARRLGAPHVELDALDWEPSWTAAEEGVFLERVQAAAAGSGWVIDGNYSRARPLLWPRAQTIVWLDYPFLVGGWRLLRRTVLRSARREELWSGNRESWRRSFASRDSILLWYLQTFRRRRPQLEAAMRDPPMRTSASCGCARRGRRSAGLRASPPDRHPNERDSAHGVAPGDYDARRCPTACASPPAPPTRTCAPPTPWSAS